MRRAQRRLGWMLLGAAVLVALAAWQWHRERASATLLPLDPASISRIDVTWQGQPTRHYVKRDDHWYRAGKSPHRVDDAYPARLAKLAATPVLEWRKTDDMHLDAIGLNAPPVIVQLDGHALAYGSLAAFGPQRFVRVGGRVAIIPASYSPRAPASAASPSSSQKS
ncbi:MAG TPA: hypothetical protein VFJ01_12420 [Oleiagrimonas sp.]|nr:hypothetical protein [Oleiagrimonas sp.]